MSHVELLASGFMLAEAPALDACGRLWVCDAIGGGIRVFGGGCGERRLLAGRRGIGGMALHADGSMLVSGRDVVSVVIDGDDVTTVQPVLDDPDATGFNDLGAGPVGELLCGVLRYRPLRGEPPVPGRLRIVAVNNDRYDLGGDVYWPNGVAVGSGWLYLSDFSTGTVLRARWEGQGELRPWWSSPSGQADGLALDASGAVLVALGSGGGVARVLPDGRTDGIIDVPATFVSSVCFHGDNLDRLVVTTGAGTVDPCPDGSVLELPAPVPGASVPRVSILLPTQSEGPP